MLNEEKRKHKFSTPKTFMKTHNVQRTHHQLRHNVSSDDFFEYNELNGKDENKLQVDEKKNKTEKFLKCSTMYNIIKFKTFRYNLPATVKINHSVLSYKLMRTVSNFGNIKNKKSGKNSKFNKK